MALPKQVQDQADALAAFDAEVEANNTAPAAPEAAAPVPEPAAQPEAPAPAAPEPAPAPADDQWEQRYKTLKGIFDAHKQTTDTQVGTLTRQLETAISRLDAKEATPAPAAPEPRTASVSEKDAETYGADLMDVIKRQATDVAHAVVAEARALIETVKADLAKLRGEMGGVAEGQVQDRRVRYFADLRTQVPDYEAINVDPLFLDHMRQVDPIAGHPRQVFLDSAFNSFDVNRTALVFQQWKATQAPAAAAATPEPVIVPPAPSLSPATSHATPPAAPTGEVRSWSRGEIDAFYADCGRGKYRGDEKAMAEIEASIDAAVLANRVTP